HYLKGTGPRPALTTEIEDNMGHWRSEAGAYPPTDATWMSLSLGSDFAQVSRGQPVVLPGSNFAGGAVDENGIVRYAATAPLATETHIAGLARLKLQVTPLGSGGQVYAELRDLDA